MNHPKCCLLRLRGDRKSSSSCSERQLPAHPPNANSLSPFQMPTTLSRLPDGQAFPPTVAAGVRTQAFPQAAPPA